MIKKIFTCALSGMVAMTMVFGAIPATGQADAFAQSVSDVTVETTSDPEVINEYLVTDEEYFDEAVVNVEDGTVTVDGEDAQADEVVEGLSEVLETETEGTEEVLDAIDEEVYDVEVDGDEISISSPYQSKRIILTGSNLKKSYGATSAVYDPSDNTYILTYDTVEDTQYAYEKLSGKYDCFVDRIYGEDTLQATKNSWGASLMKFDQVESDTQLFSNEVTVAVLDTGCNAWSSIFSNKISSKSYDFAKKTSTMTDTNGHGTNVSAIIAECTPSTVKIMNLRVFNDAGKSSDAIIMNALKYAKKNKAQVINMSMGTVADANYNGKITAKEKANFKKVCKKYNSLLKSIKSKDIVLVAAAGNNSQNVSNTWPANSAYTVAVSAMGQSGSSVYFPSFSSYGDKIDFTAPGVNIVEPSNVSGTTASMTGTSQAAPHVSAAFALIRSANKYYSYSQSYNMAKSAAVDVYDTGKDKYSGYGVILASNISRQAKTITAKNTTVKLSKTSYKYSGAEKRPSVTVKYRGYTLKEGTDYTVTYSNNVNASKSAKVTITGQTYLTGSISKKFTIKKNSQTVKLNKSKASLKVGETLQLEPTVSSGGAVKYSSSNKKIATVSSDGVVTAKKKGKATISVYAPASTNFTKSATKKCTITVKK